MDDVREPTLWRRDGWTARVIPSPEPDGGWAVETLRDGDEAPVLVGPWTMGRDKKNPKPLDQSAFTTLVKTAKDVLARHLQSERDRRHKRVVLDRANGQRIAVDRDLAGDDDDPHAILTVTDDVTGEPVHQGRVALGFVLSLANVEKFLADA